MLPSPWTGCGRRTLVDELAPARRRARALRSLLLTLSVTCWVWPGGGALAQSHAPQGKLVVGASLPLSGPLAKYGTEMERGLKLGLAQGSGRDIALLVQDDGGNAERSAANTRSLAEAGVLAVTGYHGGIAIEPMLPILEQAGLALIGVASGAENLREPTRRLVFNLRAGAREEAAAMVTQLDTVGLTEVAVLAQEDALGSAGLEGIRVELARLAMRPTAIARVRADADPAAFAKAIQSVCGTAPQALVLVLDARNALAAIRQARQRGCTPQFYAMSDAGGQLLAAGTSAGELAGVVVSQVLPHPGTAAIPLVADYQRLVRQAGAAPSYPGLEGFLYARVLAEAIRRCAREPSRRCVSQSLEGKALDIGGYPLRFSAEDHRGTRLVEMTIVTADGRFRR
jgi:ABC-type branched-subunit amino acid transport system substrate-binding protein